MDDKMKAAFESWGVERSKKISTLGIPTPYEYVEWTLDYLRNQQEQVTNDEELRRDAERYRWLRDQIKLGPLVIAKCGSWDLESWSGDDPDTRIDAAIAAEKKEERK